VTAGAVTRRGLFGPALRRLVPLDALPRPVSEPTPSQPAPLPALSADRLAEPAAAVAGHGTASLFAVQHAADERRAARDLWEATAAGSLAAVAAWRTTGFMGRLLTASGTAPGVHHWGRYESLFFTLGDFEDLAVDERTLAWRFASEDAAWRELCGGREDLRGRLGELLRAHGRWDGDHGGVVVRVDWLLVRARKPSWA
jgi:hypothetical protein